MKYAHYDEHNNLIGYYSKDVHDVIPEPTLEITEEQWQEALEINANKVEDGKLVYIEPPFIAPTKEEVVEHRQIAYADPIYGSDVLFAKANRMQLMGEDGWEEILEEAKQRFQEIKQSLPYYEENE